MSHPWFGVSLSSNKPGSKKGGVKKEELRGIKKGLMGTLKGAHGVVEAQARGRYECFIVGCVFKCVLDSFDLNYSGGLDFNTIHTVRKTNIKINRTTVYTSRKHQYVQYLWLFTVFN